MAYEALSEKEINDLRILFLEHLSGSSKSFTEIAESDDFAFYIRKLGQEKLRDFLLGMCDPSGFIFHSGGTRNRQYRTTKSGRAMIKIYKGEAELPDPDTE